MAIFRRSPPGAPRPASAADAIFSRAQQRVLGTVFGNPKRRFSIAELALLGDLPSREVRREITRLEAARLVTARRAGDERYFQANEDAPAFEELRALVVRTFGITDVIRVALASEGTRIRAAFIYGIAPRSFDAARGDIEVCVVSELITHADLTTALAHAVNILNRQINVTIFSPKELARRLREKNPTALRILAMPRIWLMGAKQHFSP